MHQDAVVLLSVGLVLCYLGFLVFRWSLTLFGFLTGGLAAYLAANLFLIPPLGVILCSVAGGLITLFLMKRFVRAGRFLLGGLAGVAVGISLSQNLLFVLVCALLGAVLIRLASQMVIVVATSFLGALLLLHAADAWWKLAEQHGPMLMRGLFLFFLLSGILVQALLKKRG